MVLGIIVVFAVYWANGMSISGKFPPTFIAAVALASLSRLETFLPVSEAVSKASSYQDSLKRLNSMETKDVSIGENERKPENIDTSEVNQKPYLFHTSVLNNLRLGNPDATEDEVYQAARQVGLHDMIMELPSGYATNMNEAGQRFSGGERQRIALARILLQKTPVVIMDEPTIGLDSLTEYQLLTVIFDTLKEKTIIWDTPFGGNGEDGPNSFYGQGKNHGGRNPSTVA